MIIATIVTFVTILNGQKHHSVVRLSGLSECRFFKHFPIQKIQKTPVWFCKSPKLMQI